MDPENELPTDATEPTAAPPEPSDQADGTSTPAADEQASAPAQAPPAGEEAPILPATEIRAVLEALIFASPQPITSREITQVMQGVPKSAWLEALEEIKADYGRDGRGLNVVEVA